MTQATCHDCVFQIMAHEIRTCLKHTLVTGKPAILGETRPCMAFRPVDENRFPRSAWDHMINGE